MLFYCPYSLCCTYTEAINYPAHVRYKHQYSPSHAYSCPVCEFTNGPRHSSVPVDSLNLLTHVTNAHADLISTVITPIATPPAPTNSYPPFPTQPTYQRKRNPAVQATGNCAECRVTDGHLTSCSQFVRTIVTTSLPPPNNPVPFITPVVTVTNTTTTTTTSVTNTTTNRITTNEPREYRDSEGRVFLERRLEENTRGECLICFESFIAKQDIARLECLCMFHKPCIILWFTKSEQNGCPLHKAKEETSG